MFSSLVNLDLAALCEGLRKGDFTALDLTQTYLEHIETKRFLNLFITLTPEIALEKARESDKRIRAGTQRPLEGIPLAVKDSFCTKNVLTTAASRMLYNFIPPYESTVTQRLFDAGCVLLGKTNLDEFAMGSSTATSYYGPSISPWSKRGQRLTPGGSSGGSAAAVASKCAVAALGTDTGGSIRQPASFCGIVGIKPTYGRCSRWGIVAFSSSLDQAGPFARTVKDSAILLEAMAGHDPKDVTSSPEPVPPFHTFVGRTIKGLRVGIPEEYYHESLDPEVMALWEKGQKCLEDAGAILVPVSLPNASLGLSTYYILALAEASSNLARYDGLRYGLRVEGTTLDDLYSKTRSLGFGAEVKRRILSGAWVLSQGSYQSYYLQAQKVRRLICDDFARSFQQADTLLIPATPTASFDLDKAPSNPIAMCLNDLFTVPISLAGLPAISVPSGLSKEGLPLGLQLVGRFFDEQTLFSAADVMEKAFGLFSPPQQPSL